jgi:hypothetical protein
MNLKSNQNGKAIIRIEEEIKAQNRNSKCLGNYT